MAQVTKHAVVVRTKLTFALEVRNMRNKLQLFWRQIVTDYTSRQLTYRTDIMPAISSIASRLSGYIESPYHAGLWQDRFIEDLCWRPAVSYGDKVKPLITGEKGDIEAGLPSWSWMSVPQPIGYSVIDGSGRFTPHCEVLHNSWQ
jgi:hypothetical protein